MPRSQVMFSKINGETDWRIYAGQNMPCILTVQAIVFGGAVPRSHCNSNCFSGMAMYTE